MTRSRRTLWAILILAGLTPAAVVLALLLGSANLAWEDMLRSLSGGGAGRAVDTILWQVRLPRILLSYVVGGGLAVAGCAMQGVFKNPMADPHILGVSSGAGLGAGIAIILGLSSGTLGLGPVALCAFLGGWAAAVLVHTLAHVRGRITTLGLLLSGVAVSSLLSATLSGLMMLQRQKMEQILLWTMGSFASATWSQLIWAAPLIVVGAALCFLKAPELNVMLLGDEQAMGLGIHVQRTRRYLTIATALCAAAAVSVSGIIGFVGLMVPHILRLFVGPDHKRLMPLCFFGGGLFMILVDTLARTLAAPQEISVGILTAVLGGPFFLILLRKRGMDGQGGA